MKKLSISLVALLAIVLAVSSAFTSKMTYVDRFFENVGRQVADDGQFIPTTKSETELTGISTSSQFDSWAAANCDENPEVICGAHIQVDDEELLEPELVTLKYGYVPE